MEMNGFLLLRMAGGVGIFLYGMNLMSLSLEKTAGSRMKEIIEACTKNRVVGVAAGALVTMIIQSSSATTVMVVGFVNAGIMNLMQAAGVIIGANIGTTVTAQIVAFDLDAAAPVIAGLGAIAHMAVRSDRAKNIAQVFVGFGLLFTGIVVLKENLGGIGKDPEIMEFLAGFDGASLGSYGALLLAGTVLTVLVQSSSTVTGIMVAMASQGLLSTTMAVPLILGSNLGTTCTALISAIGASRNARRAAWIHVMFNVGGVVLFAALLQNITLDFVIHVSGDDIPRQIANFHTAFNLVTAILILPFIRFLVKGAVGILPLREEETQEAARSLDSRMLESPAIAIKQAREALSRMTALAVENYMDAIGGLTVYSRNLFADIRKKEDQINGLQREIKDFLKELMQKDISAHENREINVLFSITNDMERMADNAFNIAETCCYKAENQIRFSNVALRDLNELHRFVLDSCEDISRGIPGLNEVYAADIIARHPIINELEREFRERHMNRLNQGECDLNAGVIYLETISSIERAADRIRKAAHVIEDFRKNT